MTIWLGDLGFGQQPSESSNEWQAQYAKYTQFHRYYSGIIFKERVESPGEADPPLLYPVKMNLIKLMCHTQADSLWGEWEDRIFHLQAHPKEGKVDPDRIQSLTRYFYSVFDSNALEPKLWECGLDQMRFGGAVIKISRDPKKEYGVRLERIPVMSFYPVWSPDSYDELIEVWVVTQISGRAAKATFGVDTENEFATRAEHWLRDRYENFIDGKRIDRFCGPNRLSRIPFEYIPRLRSDSFYGEALTEDITGVQDELNMRVGDMGEAITYNAHPIKYGYNLPKDINDAGKFPYAPDQLWDLGKTMPGQDPPFLGVLEADDPIPEAAFQHIQFVYDWARVAGYSPPVAFGEDEGSQRSGATLQLRMWPLTRAIRRSRMYWKPAFMRLMKLIVEIAEANGTKSIPREVLETYHNVRLDIDFAPILPRERAELVNEVVMRAQTEPASISQEGALELLGHQDPQLEIDRIREQEEEQQERADGDPGGRGQGGERESPEQRQGEAERGEGCESRG